jgi:hypothetical protein
MDAIESIEYRGFNINIYHDDDPSMNPIDDWDMLGTMTCWHKRYSLGHKQPNCDPDEFMKQLAIEADPNLEDTIDYWDSGIGWRRLSIKYTDLNQAVDACEQRVKSLIDKAIDKYYIILPHTFMTILALQLAQAHFIAPGIPVKLDSFMYQLKMS